MRHGVTEKQEKWFFFLCSLFNPINRFCGITFGKCGLVNWCFDSISLLVKGNWKVITSSVFDVVVVALEPRAYGSVVATNKTEETIEARIIGVYASFLKTVTKSPLTNIASSVAFLFEHVDNDDLRLWQVSSLVETSSVNPEGQPSGHKRGMARIAHRGREAQHVAQRCPSTASGSK